VLSKKKTSNIKSYLFTVPKTGKGSIRIKYVYCIKISPVSHPKNVKSSPIANLCIFCYNKANYVKNYAGMMHANDI